MKYSIYKLSVLGVILLLSGLAFAGPVLWVEKDILEISFKVTSFVRVGFKNSGDSPLKILSVFTSCKCLTARVKDLELEAGEATDLEVVFDSAEMKKEAYFVMVQTNDPGKEWRKIEFRNRESSRQGS